MGADGVAGDDKACIHAYAAHGAGAAPIEPSPIRTVTVGPGISPDLQPVTDVTASLAGSAC
jgi:hypothetical protein